MLKLKRRNETFEAYHVMSGSFQLGVILRHDHAPVESWAWSIGTVYLLGDGRGLSQGGGHSREECMSMLGDRWRTWLAAANLKEGPADELAPRAMCSALTMTRSADGPSENYCVERNGVFLGLIGRTYGQYASGWFWRISSILRAEDGSYHVAGGAETREQALNSFAVRWRAWLAAAGLEEG